MNLPHVRFDLHLVSNRGEYQLAPAWETAVAQWADHLTAAGHTRPTIKLRTSTIRRIAHELATPHPRDVTGDDLVALAAKHPWSPDYRRSVRTSLTQFYTYLGGANPAEQLPKTPESVPNPKPVPDPIWEQAFGAAAPRERLMLLLAGRAGLRRGEITRLRHEDLTGHPGRWTLHIAGKGRKPRTIPIADDVADAIGTGTGWVFPGNDDGHLSANWVGKILSDLLGPGWSGHKLRHRYASRGYAGTRDMLAVQRALGHASPATTQRYVAVPDDTVRAVANAA